MEASWREENEPGQPVGLARHSTGDHVHDHGRASETVGDGAEFIRLISQTLTLTFQFGDFDLVDFGNDGGDILRPVLIHRVVPISGSQLIIYSLI